jgi:FtsP/CotA-like multicopper oxidase with cupredoxin domain
MRIKNIKRQGRVLLISLLLLTLWVLPAQAVIEGLTGATFNLTAKADHITTGEGNSVLIWGYANGAARAQYPGPTLIVNQGATVTINLTNVLPQAVSMVFPGQNVAATGGTAGLLTQEAPGDGTTTVTYTFVAGEPGTYTYYSGTNMDLQIEMGLLGALIVRPTGFDINSPATFQAYNHADSAYDYEYLYLITEMDPKIHEMVEMGNFGGIDTTAFYPVYWFINGRNFPDTVSPAGAAWLPTQPYNAFMMMHPGDRLLLRWIGAGHDGHPIHLHGNNFSVIAKDGRLLSSNDPDLETAGADLAYSRYTHNVMPGETVDAIFHWTGYKLGWDMYGHAPGDPLETNEYAPDHGKPLPVTMPEVGTFTAGALYSGSPFLGGSGFLPPGEGALNTFGGYFYVWHSHHEKEIINNDIFIGGMIALMVVAPHSVTIPTTPAL